MFRNQKIHKRISSIILFIVAAEIIYPIYIFIFNKITVIVNVVFNKFSLGDHMTFWVYKHSTPMSFVFKPLSIISSNSTGESSEPMPQAKLKLPIVLVLVRQYISSQTMEIIFLPIAKHLAFLAIRLLAHHEAQAFLEIIFLVPITIRSYFTIDQDMCPHLPLFKPF